MISKLSVSLSVLKYKPLCFHIDFMNFKSINKIIFRDSCFKAYHHAHILSDEVVEGKLRLVDWHEINHTFRFKKFKEFREQRVLNRSSYTV